MNKQLPRQEITLPPLEQMLPELYGIQLVSQNIAMRDIIVKPLLDLAGQPIAIGALIGTLGMLIEKYRHYLSGMNPDALVTFRLMANNITIKILETLIQDQALRQTVINELLAPDMGRTTNTAST